MTHHTKDKGDLAVSLVITDLLEKGYEVYTPFSEHSKADLIATNSEGRCLKLQVKYRADGFLSPNTSWNDKKGNHKARYKKADFDYYALYLPEIKEVVYPPFDMRGKTIKFTLPKNNGSRFYWYEDYKKLGAEPQIRSLEDFGVIIKTKGRSKKYPKVEIYTKIEHPCLTCGTLTSNFKYCSALCASKALERVERPSKEELHKLIWEFPTTTIAAQFGVSDNAVGKWCKAYGIDKPPRGYWAKVRAR